MLPTLEVKVMPSPQNFTFRVYGHLTGRTSILYSGKFWREKILANLASMHGFAKILLAIFLNTESVEDTVHEAVHQ